MSATDLIGLAISILLFGYLGYVLLRAERF